MGRHSNIILLDTKTNVILDSLKHVSLAVNRHRTVYAGAEYVAPPAQHKINPLQIETADDFIRPLDFLSGNMDKQLVGAFMGISPLFAKVVKESRYGKRESIIRSIFLYTNTITISCIYTYNDYCKWKKFFYLFPLTHFKEKKNILISERIVRSFLLWQSRMIV